jgi:hypothetical protein
MFSGHDDAREHSAAADKPQVAAPDAAALAELRATIWRLNILAGLLGGWLGCLLLAFAAVLQGAV